VPHPRLKLTAFSSASNLCVSSCILFQTQSAFISAQQTGGQAPTGPLWGAFICGKFSVFIRVHPWLPYTELIHLPGKPAGVYPSAVFSLLSLFSRNSRLDPFLWFQPFISSLVLQ
jgi:hypothetical protein